MPQEAHDYSNKAVVKGCATPSYISYILHPLKRRMEKTPSVGPKVYYSSCPLRNREYASMLFRVADAVGLRETNRLGELRETKRLPCFKWYQRRELLVT